MVQIFDVLVAASSNFPEKARGRESFSLTMDLTVGFGSVAAWSPTSRKLGCSLTTPRGEVDYSNLTCTGFCHTSSGGGERIVVIAVTI
jgi:hypothetical protein